MSDTSKGFRYRGRRSGGPATIQAITAKDTDAAISRGDMVNLESGEFDLGATGDANFLGVVHEITKATTDSSTKVQIITDPDAIYGVYDNNARNIGDTLDLSGATGAQTVAASSNKEFVVIATKINASDETLVCFNVGKHLLNKAQ